jgi:G3E family GTPase
MPPFLKANLLCSSNVDVPITIIGGYLGAGKTTLINKVLHSSDNLSGTAVLVNDFGSVNIDAELIRSRSRDGQVLALSNGCVCCSIQDDFTQGLETLRNTAVTHIVLEASGIASPTKLRAQCHYPGFYPRGCVVLIDATQHTQQQQNKYVGQLVKQQVAEADLIVVSKDDLAPGFSPAQAALSCRDQTLLALILDAKQTIQHIPAGESVPPPEFSTSTLRQHRGVSRTRLNKLLATLPSSIVRVKGFVDIDGQLMLLQKVGGQHELTDCDVTSQPYLVFINASADAPQTVLRDWQEWHPHN